MQSRPGAGRPHHEPPVCAGGGGRFGFRFAQGTWGRGPCAEGRGSDSCGGLGIGARVRRSSSLASARVEGRDMSHSRLTAMAAGSEESSSHPSHKFKFITALSNSIPFERTTLRGVAVLHSGTCKPSTLHPRPTQRPCFGQAAAQALPPKVRGHKSRPSAPKKSHSPWYCWEW